MMKRYAYVLAASAAFAGFAFGAAAQSHSAPMPAQQKEHILIAAAETGTGTNLETLSGINLRPVQRGNFVLDFSQTLHEDALLEITDTAGQLVYQKPVHAADSKTTWRYNVGHLKPDTYLIEVKTSNTTYWTKFKVKK